MTVPEMWQRQNRGRKKEEKKNNNNNEANWMVTYSAKLDHRTKQHTQFGVFASNGSRDMARTKVAEIKEKRKGKKEKRKKKRTRAKLYSIPYGNR